MSKEDEAERQMLARRGIIPARPKGAPGPTPPPPLDDLLSKRRQTMAGPARMDFLSEGEKQEAAEADAYIERNRSLAPPADADPFEAFVEIMRILRRLPKKHQKLIIEMFADLMD